MSTRYPGIEPEEHGMLDVGDGQSLYWEVCGNRSGKPALVLHGGPGSGCSPYMRSCSTLAAIGSCCSISAAPDAIDRTRAILRWTCRVNATDHLVADIERLRERLG